MSTVLGADTGSATLREADTAARSVVRGLAERAALAGAVVATHLTHVSGPVVPGPHVTLSVEAPELDAGALADLLARALPGALVTPSRQDWAAGVGAAAHASRSSGRAVHFPGAERLGGTVPVGEVLSRTAVQAVRVLGAQGPPDPAVPLQTRDHVRPVFEGGRLVLVTQWAAGRTLVPFETPTPTPCCADHA